MKYLVYVDFDGVLTSNRAHFAQPSESYPMWCRFDPIVMEFFNKIDNTFDDVYFVWTTTWRNRMEENLHTEHWAYSMWYNAGFRGHFYKPWRVNPEDHYELHGKRAEEIRLFNEEHKPKDFIIFDDTDYDFNNHLRIKRFVKTDPANGMLFKHMRDAWAMMGTWDRKR